MSGTARQDALERARANAPFLARLIERWPARIGQFLGEGAVAAIGALGDPVTGDAPETHAALRRHRQQLALLVALGDLSGELDLGAVTGHLGRFADIALDRAIAAIIADRTPGEEPRGFAVIALGKHGSRELNYSSDIDPIFLYDPETLPRKAREEPPQAAQRIARRLIDMLAERDADGFVFRVDMRLRPASEASPLAIPIEAAITHYESSAVSWERAAFIRARAAAGDVALGQGFLDTIQPFVWRRSLDFGTIDDIASLTRQIRDHHQPALAPRPGFDLKRGPGGIREIEFYAQAQQLVHGGRNAALRAPATRDALAALADAGLIAEERAGALSRNYELLRTIEHRLQMIEDRQTHSLPDKAGAMDAVARLHGLADGAALVALLEPAAAEGARVYGEFLAAQAPRGGPDDGATDDEPLPDDPVALETALAMLGWRDPANPAQRIAAWREGGTRALQQPAGRRAFETVLPDIMRSLAGSADPETALARFDRLLPALPSGLNLFNLLAARPGLLSLFADIMSHAPSLAADLARRGDLLDGLIDTSALEPLPEPDDLRAELGKGGEDLDYERLLDLVRARVGERRFALGARLIAGRCCNGPGDPLAVSRDYASLAEATLGLLADAARREFEAVHGRIPGSDLAILALGRLGGRALTHASDLDLIYLFSGEPGLESDGERPLGTTRYFNRLAQRISAALSVPTASGPLYEVDTRLRPSGMQGLLAVSLESFFEYQSRAAWTWEHMALCRARPVYGPEDVASEVEMRIMAMLRSGRSPENVRERALTMRIDMAAHKPPRGPLDAKLRTGGLVDCEFLVHVLQLTRGVGLSPELPRAIAALADAGLVDRRLGEAHDLMSRLLVTVRLVAPDGAIPPPASRELIARACGLEDWDKVLAAYDAARHLVAAEFERVVGERSDTEMGD